MINLFKGDYLFPKGEKEGEAPVYQLNKQHRKTLERSDLKFRLYDCRRTFATEILDNGTNLLTLASILEHSSPNQVTRYAHPSETGNNNAIKQCKEKKQSQSKNVNLQ